MITEEAAEHILIDLFAHRAQDRADPAAVLQTVQDRAARRRITRQTQPFLMVRVAAAVVVIAVVSTFLVHTQRPNEVAVGVRPTPAAAAHPGLDQLTGSALT